MAERFLGNKGKQRVCCNVCYTLVQVCFGCVIDWVQVCECFQ